MRHEVYDNPFKRQLQLESQFYLAKDMKNEGSYSMDEYHRLVAYLTQDFMDLKNSEPNVTMRWDFTNDPTGKVMMELTKAAILSI
ncbi:MAG: hypothetical protein AAF489_00970 [Bacteroidota bacterium]